MPTEPLRPETIAIKAGRPTGPGQPINTPLVTASNYRQAAPDQVDGRAYSRGDGTPTVQALEEAVGELEGGWAVAFGSGMAAIAAVLDDLPVGARVVAPNDCYQGVTMSLLRGRDRFGWKLETVDLVDTDRWLALIETGPDLVWNHRPIRCSPSPTSPPSAGRPSRPASPARSTTPSPRRCCSDHSTWGPPTRSTAPPSSSVATPTSSAV